MSSGTAGLTPEQLASLTALKQRVNEAVNSNPAWKKDWEGFSDFWIAKFLRARKWSVDDAYKMVVNHLQWRRTFAGGIENVTEDMVKPVINTGIFCYRHICKEKRVIEWVRCKLYDKNHRDLDLFQKFIVYNSEFGRRFMTPEVQYKTCIFDCTGIGRKQLDLTLGRFITDMGANNYPDTMGRLIIYNAPMIFWASWAIFKPLIDPVTVSKIHFVNKIADLEQFIPRSKIPTWLGGEEAYDHVYAYVPDSDSKDLAILPPAAPVVAKFPPAGVQAF